MSVPTFNTVTVSNGVKVWYREAGERSNPSILLLHGFPTSSNLFRHLITLLSPKFHLVAPDLPGFGLTELPEGFSPTFANIAETIDSFVDKISLTKFAFYGFDYGAFGFRLALKRPDSITAIIVQSCNAYVEGLGPFWEPIKKLWKNDTKEGRDDLAERLLSLETTRWQYEHGSPDLSKIEPQAYLLDWYFLQQPGQTKIQADLFYDYRNNLDLYPAFQEYFRTSNVPVLAVWGKNDDQIFPPVGAEAYKKDVKNFKLKLLDAGHFALETNVEDIAREIEEFYQEFHIK